MCLFLSLWVWMGNGLSLLHCLSLQCIIIYSNKLTDHFFWGWLVTGWDSYNSVLQRFHTRSFKGDVFGPKADVLFKLDYCLWTIWPEVWPNCVWSNIDRLAYDPEARQWKDLFGSWSLLIGTWFCDSVLILCYYDWSNRVISWFISWI